jgi:hypothetical protein
VTTPRITAGAASRMNSHCHAARPNQVGLLDRIHRPQDGRWLDREEREWLIATLERENRQIARTGSHPPPG